MRSTRWAAATLVLALAAPGAVAAQQTRNQRLTAAQQAYEDFETARALDLLRTGLNPAEGPQDSAWARGIQLIAQILTESGDTAQSSVWLRWAFRLAPSIPIDSVTFLPEVVASMRAARTVAGRRGPGDLVTASRWTWAAPGAPAGQGRLQILAPRMSAPLNALVQGAGLIQAGETRTVAAGTYDIQAAAEGFLPTQITREVLPGVTTVLEFNLTPVAAGVLSATIRTAVVGQIVPLSVYRFQGDSSCATGALVSRAGLVLTTYEAIRGADHIAAMVSGRRVSDEIRVLSWDAVRNTAVLQLPVTRTDSLPLATEAAPGQFVWGLGFPNCVTPSDTRARVGAAVQPRIELSDSIRATEHVGPLINNDGHVVGLLVGSQSAVPLADIRSALDAARGQVNAAQKLTPAQVALRQNHAYGAMAISADVTGVTVRVTPLEAWQWPGLAWTGPLPRTFIGPMGRYQLDLTIPNQPGRRLEFTIRPGASERFPINLAPVATAGGAQLPAGAARKKGGFPWPIAIIGAGGAGAAAFLLLGKKSGPPPTTGTGSISIIIPNP